MEQPDEKMWELEISQCDDGDILLAQGRCGGCNDETMVRLHRSQIPLIAELGGFVSSEDVENSEDQLRVRIGLMALLVRAHIKPGEPLRDAIDALSNSIPTKPLLNPLAASSLPIASKCLNGVDEGASEHPGRCGNDLFSEIDEGV